jgi:hypothetical protein
VTDPSSLRAGVLRSGMLAAWGSAWLAGDASLDEAARGVGETPERPPTAVGAPAGWHRQDVVHQVVGLPAEPAAVSLAWALGHLEAGGVQRLRTVLPAPGDVTGLPPAQSFRAAALQAGQGVVTVGSDAALGLVPSEARHGPALEGSVLVVTWQVHALGEVRWVPERLGDADLAFARTLGDATRDLVGLDVAALPRELVDAVRALRSGGGRSPELPDGYAPRARTLLERALAVGDAVDLARATSGAVVHRHDIAGRDAALRELAAAARRAAVASLDGYRPETLARLLAAGQRNDARGRELSDERDGRG